jgi:cyclohexyl-isocyanide hydratase
MEARIMDRRQFATLAATALASLTVPAGVAARETQAAGPTPADANRAMEEAMRGPRLQLAMLVYPQFTALDLIGPHTFLAALMNVDVHLVWKDKQPVPIDRGGTAIVPTTTLADCPKNLDLLFVPGGTAGTAATMKDDAVLDFLADRGSRAKYVTSVCTGSMLLGCAGLLKGYRATSHWVALDLLPLVGATPVQQRVVEDRNRITGAGVTSGIDFGLVVASRVRGTLYAEMLQLINEYNPQPPFDTGTPAKAGSARTEHLRAALGPSIEAFRVAAQNAQKAKRL